MRIGAVEIQPLIDGHGVEQAGEIISRFSDVDAWRCHPEAFGHDGRWEFPVGGFLIRTRDRVVVLDTGVGPVDEGSYRGGGMLDRLAEHGVAADDVTDVVFSHLHFDHIGWASVDGRVTFPRATHRVHEADWEHFMLSAHAPEAAKAKLSPIESRLEPFTDDFMLAPGVSTRWSPGHTPGSTVLVVDSEGERAILLGDVVHSTVQLGERDWTVVWDVDPQAASDVRNRIANAAAAKRDLLVAAHFPELRFGRVILPDNERRFVAA